MPIQTRTKNNGNKEIKNLTLQTQDGPKTETKIDGPDNELCLCSICTQQIKDNDKALA